MAEYEASASDLETGKYWREELDHAKKAFEDWRKSAKTIVERYRDERATNDAGISKFNILWSNVQVMRPSLYGRPAKPEVSRRHMDSDPVGRLSSTMLERVLDYETTQFPDFHHAMMGAVEDRLLGGRGTVWQTFDAKIVNEVVQPPKGIEYTGPVSMEKVDQTYSKVEYVYWEDFYHSLSRNWEEVWWVARCVYLTREQGVERFGESFALVPLAEYQQKGDDKAGQDKAVSYLKQAKVFEIWNKRTKKVCWIAEGYTPALDEKDDPLKLEGFFPCPKPLYATTTTGKLIPVPDYKEYQDQADELDKITARIDVLVDAVRVAGCYNSEFKELARLFSRNGNELIPVANWQALAEKNGLKGAIDLVDLGPIAQALGILFKARDAQIQIIYEVIGLSDILRGADTSAEETLGAQQLKAQFGSLRLRTSQVDVARFASDIFKLKAQVICSQYPPELILQMAAVTEIPEARDPQLLTAALAMLKNSTIRDFHIAVESDSLAQVDDQAEKGAAVEAITAIGQFLKESIPMVAQAPETLPMAKEMLLFLVRRFRAGRSLEASIEQTMMMLQQKAMAAAQNPPPSEAEIEAKAQRESDMIRAQVETQAHQMKAQMDSQVQSGKLQAEMQLEQMKAMMTKQQEETESRLKMIEVAYQEKFETLRTQMENNAKIRVAEINAASKLEAANISAEAQKEAAKNRPQPTGAPA